ncbi:MAG: phosphodiester glycosidase family protein [Calditrichaeota bacterium]|nr:phosphodiester glycosidase family protein [Calditrichota bacterium]MCB0303199.1 phosphodiester glycosidase family protein [Calditrichota bacterium]MCB9090408.1 phosphodiester glycosidase family protein [Calditrichia bacterium]
MGISQWKLWPAMLLLLVGFNACRPDQTRYAEVPMVWTPIDSLNANLPEGIRVYAGLNDTLPLRAWYVTIDEPHPEIYTRVVISDDMSDRRETVTSFARDLGATVAINGGYFVMGHTPALHAGLLMSSDTMMAPATRSVLRDSLRYEAARAAIGFTSEDEVAFAWVTTRRDTLFQWPAPPSHRPGKPAKPLDYRKAQIWPVRDALSAGPMLLRKGKIRVTADDEVFFGSSIPDIHPRTAAGRTKSGTLILLVVDGRQSASRGVNLQELAVMMRDLGAVDALNLDGGGSSALVVNNVLLNRPTGGMVQREVMSALVTFYRPATTPPMMEDEE